MTDLAIAVPPYLDLTFAGLTELPAAGQERFCDDFLSSPGGGAIIAVGAARLGLDAALVTPLGRDWAGDLLRAQLAADGVAIAPATVDRTPVTAVLPTGGDRAMATYDPGEPPDPEHIAQLAPRAMVVTADRLDLVPPGVHAYLIHGDAEADAGLPHEPDVRAILANEGEALRLTGAATAQEAALQLARRVPAAVVTLGHRGALAASDGRIIHAPGHDVDVVDTTGAGDLFTAAWVWADLDGADLKDRLERATLYAARSVAAPTGADGALTRDQLAQALTREKELS